MKRQIDDLEKRVADLEKRMDSLAGSKSVTGLRVKDANNQVLGTSPVRSISSDASSKLTDKQKKEIQKQIELIKKNRSESQKIIDQIMNDDY